MVKGEWLPIFERAGLAVADYWANVTDQTRAAIRALPHIDERFAQYPFEELAAVHSYFLLAPAARKQTRTDRPGRDAIDNLTSQLPLDQLTNMPVANQSGMRFQPMARQVWGMDARLMRAPRTHDLVFRVPWIISVDNAPPIALLSG